MKWVMSGKAWKFGDQIISDLIVLYPRYKDVSDPKELAKICMIGIDPEFPQKVSKGDFIVAGKNFGRGHIHTQAHLSVKATGVSAVIAESFDRKWFRTAITYGLPVLVCRDISQKVEEGNKLEVDLEKGEIKNLSTSDVVQAEPLPEFLLSIIEAGDLKTYLKKRVSEMQTHQNR